MIAFPTDQTSADIQWHAGFLALVPRIERYARSAFGDLSLEAREDAVQEVTARCMCAYRRLYERGELYRAFASTLVRYAVAQYRAGRRVGTSQCSRDLCSTRARQRSEIKVLSQGTEAGGWRDALVDNRRTPVPDQVCFRVDFPRWLQSQSHRDRRIAERLCIGCSTQDVAGEFRISPGRVSQLRRRLYESWNQFIAVDQARRA